MALGYAYDSAGNAYRIDVELGGLATTITPVPAGSLNQAGTSYIPAIRVSDIIKRALRKLGAIPAGETPTTQETEDGRVELNSMLDAWNNENLLCYDINRNVFPLVAGKQTYSVGPGGDFDMTRPSGLEYAYLQVTSGSLTLELPIELVSDAAWASIALKGLSGGFSFMGLYQTPYPLGTLSLWPIPAGNGATGVVLGTLQKLGRFSSISELVTLPDGYEDALVYNLAIRLAPDYDKEPSVIVASMADNLKASIKRRNSLPIETRCDSALTGGGGGSNYMRIYGG